MKVSEAIDQLKAGDTVWVKGMVDAVYQGWYPGINIREVGWFYENTEISLTEPQAEKVEVPDFVAEWIELCKEKADLSSCLNGYYEIGDGTIVRPRGLSETFYDWLSDYDHMHDLARAYLDGYEVEEEPQWVVRQGGTILYLQGFRNSLDGDVVKQWCSYDGCIKFTDKSKAEAVATLVDGSVEEA